MGYRLHIDIPLNLTEDDAIKHSIAIMSAIENILMSGVKTEADTINYRLGHDDDRQKSNYLDKNENGHVSNKKSKILLKRELTAAEDRIE